MWNLQCLHHILRLLTVGGHRCRQNKHIFLAKHLQQQRQELNLMWNQSIGFFMCLHLLKSMFIDEAIIYNHLLRSIQGSSSPWPNKHVSFFLVEDADRSSLMNMVCFISGWIRILQMYLLSTVESYSSMTDQTQPDLRHSQPSSFQCVC